MKINVKIDNAMTVAKLHADGKMNLETLRKFMNAYEVSGESNEYQILWNYIWENDL